MPNLNPMFQFKCFTKLIWLSYIIHSLYIMCDERNLTYKLTSASPQHFQLLLVNEGDYLCGILNFSHALEGLVFIAFFGAKSEGEWDNFTVVYSEKAHRLNCFRATNLYSCLNSVESIFAFKWKAISLFL